MDRCSLPRRLTFVSSLFLACVFVFSTETTIHAEESPYQPNWDSLRKYNYAPDWFRDAKFGIYFHWGVYSVPAFGNEWYPRRMHDLNEVIFKHHSEKYGSPAEFGYDRFVPDFTAEKFNADEWVDLFYKAGARFAGPVAEHHDGYSMWDSDETPWNSQDTGPHRDILGEFAVAARKRDMKLVATFHHARNNLYEKEHDGKKEWTGHYDGAKRNFPEVLDDPQRAFLYGYMPREQFLEMWTAKLKEVINKYHPDLIWFDSWLDEIPAERREEFVAYYVNSATQHGQEIVLTYKQQDFPQGVGILDIEKGAMDKLTKEPWLTDDTISLGSWCYTQDLKIKDPKVVLHSLIDIVSKNGQLLLNISPMADGTIPENQREVLLAMGAWLDKYGEAIYGTRPFVTYGHGTTQASKGHFGGIALTQGYTAEDIRYTTKGDLVYAIQLGKPEIGSKLLLPPFAEHELKVVSVSLVGSDEKLKWEMMDKGLQIYAPASATDETATVYKIQAGE